MRPPATGHNDPTRPGHPEVTAHDALKAAAERLTGVPKWAPFPIDHSPRVVRDYALAVAANLSLEPAAVMTPLLSCLAGIAGTAFRMVMDERAAKPWVIRPILWTVLIARSGTTKSAAWEAGDDLANMVEGAYRTANDLARDRFRRELDEWAEKDRADRGPKPEPPANKRLLVDDVTVEAVGAVLADNPRGLLLSTDELRNWFDAFSRYKSGGGTDAARWLVLHGGKRLVIDRKGGDRPSVFIQHAACSVSGTIQPRIFARMIGDEERDSGLLARLLLCLPPGRNRPWRPTPDGDRSGYHAQRTAMELAEKMRGLPEGVEVTPSPEAVEAYMAWQHPWAYETFLVDDDELTALRAKLEEMALRIALLYFVVDHAFLKDWPKQLPAEYVRAGIATAEWFHREALRVYATFTQVPELEADYRDLMTWIADKTRPGSPLEGGFTLRDLVRGRRASDPADAAEKVQQLLDAGLIRVLNKPTGPKGGRPVDLYLPNLRDTTPSGDIREPGEEG
jgi:hypothetical protein